MLRSAANRWRARSVYARRFYAALMFDGMAWRHATPGARYAQSAMMKQLFLPLVDAMAYCSRHVSSLYTLAMMITMPLSDN